MPQKIHPVRQWPITEQGLEQGAHPANCVSQVFVVPRLALGTAGLAARHWDGTFAQHIGVL